MPQLDRYTGTRRKLVLAFDVGTTFSGIGYAILDPGDVPKIQAVTRFPGQETGDFKIPSVLWYTQDGQVRAVGAEARASALALEAEDEDLIFVEWFKLHLRPDTMLRTKLVASSLPPLPPGKTVVEVFADFMKYLFACAKNFIVETHPSGTSLWNSMESEIEFILSHPNGWEGPQQSKMRIAAVQAGLIPDTDAGHQRVHFVTEGEASLNYCVDSGLAVDAMQAGKTVMIVDAGGGTVDLSTYHFVESEPLTVDEIAPAECIMQGSTRVNVRAAAFLRSVLANSRYGNDLDIQSMMENFEKSAKPTFKDPKERSFIKFGSMNDKDPAVGIRRGQFPLEGADLEKFFEPSITEIVNSIKQQRSAATKSVSLALLVGGFAASPWLFSRLKVILHGMGMEIARPDNHTNKAVAEGAISFYLSRRVVARVARLTYGVECNWSYDSTKDEHSIRQHKIYQRPSGRMVVADGFSAILTKGTRVRDQEEHTQAYSREATVSSSLNLISTRITCYRGPLKKPRWTDNNPDHFTTLCTVEADTSYVSRQAQHGPNGVFYEQDFQVVLSCGKTELKAQIKWEENGVEKRGPAKIVYDDDVVAC